MSGVVLGGLCLLLVAAPFERLEPLLRLPGQNVSSSESVMLLVFAAWGLTLVAARRRPVWQTPLTAPGLAMLAAAALAAALAPADRANALHMVGRLGLAAGVFLLTVNAAADRPRIRIVATTVAVAGAAIGALMVLEYLGAVPVVAWLRPFRRSIALVGAQVRASGPFQYPTIASMYLEIAFALALGWTLAVVDEKRGRLFVPVLVAATIAEGVILTFTRSGLITMAVSLGVMAAVRVSRRGAERGGAALAAIAVILAVQMLTSRSAEALRLRLTSEGQDAWYRATVEAPWSVDLRTGETVALPIEVTNDGRLTWDSNAQPPIRLAYHWLNADDDVVVVWEGLRTLFPEPVPPGESVKLEARVRAPGRPGDFRLAWDLEQQNRLWFSTEPDAVFTITRAAVNGPVVALNERLSGPRLMPRPERRPGRGVLWRAAAQLFAAHPFAGIGLDNYRLQYGPPAKLPRADPRVHSNNMYIEWVVGTGLVGAMALAWYAFRAGRSLLVSWAGHDSLAHGIAAAMVAIAVHGLADSFLSFTATYIVMAAVAGLLVTTSAVTEAYAYRL